MQRSVRQAEAGQMEKSNAVLACRLREAKATPPARVGRPFSCGSDLAPRRLWRRTSTRCLGVPLRDRRERRDSRTGPVRRLHDGLDGTAILAINFGDSPFGIRVDGSYGEIKTKSDLQAFLGTGTTRLITGTADLVIGARHGPVQPYLIGGVGAYDLRFQGQQVDTGNVFSDSTTRFGWNAGLGIAFPVASTMAIFVEARYTSVSTDGNRFSDSVHTGGSRFTYVPVSVGFIF